MAKLKVGDLIPLATAEDLEKVEEKLKDAEYTPYLTNYGTVFTAGEGYDKEGNAVDYSSSVVNGQVSGVVKGLTATNLIKNGKGNTLNGWDYRHVAIENDYFKMNTSASTILTQSFNCIANHKYYFTCKYWHITSDYGIHIALRDSGSVVTHVTITEISNTFTRFSRILTPTRNANELAIYRATGTGGDFAIKEIMVIDLTATFGAGNEPTVEECDKIFSSWFDGTKSTVGAIRVKSVGKNLFNKNINFAKYNKPSQLELTKVQIDGRPNVLKIKANNRNNLVDLGIKFKPNTSYVFKFDMRGTTSELEGAWDASLRIIYTDGSFTTADVRFSQWETKTIVTPQDKSIDYIAFRSVNGFDNNYVSYIDLDTFQIEEGTQATEYEPYKESTMYILGRDEEGNILELRSLPNGVKDEIHVAERKAIIRTKKKIIQENDISIYEYNYYTGVVLQRPLDSYGYGLNETNDLSVVKSYFVPGFSPDRWGDNEDTKINTIYARGNFTELVIRFEKGTTLEQIKSTLIGTELFYQLAEPVEVPIQVTGNLKVYKNGSIFVDFIMPRKDNYGEDGINVGIPIKEIVSLYKVEKESGVERELNISNVEFSSDRTSFILPDLEDGDLVKWEFVPDIETTTPITAIKYPINLKGQIENNSNAIQKISKDIDILDAKIIGNTQSIEDLSNKIGHNKQGIEELFTQVDSNKAGIESLDVRVTDNRNAIDQIGVIAVENQNMLADIVPQVNANRDNIETLEVEVNSVKSSVDGLNNRITETEQDMGSVQSEISSLNQHKEQLNNYLRVDSNGNFIIGTQDNPSNIKVSDEGVTVTANRLYIGNFVIEKYNNDILIVRPIE